MKELIREAGNFIGGEVDCSHPLAHALIAIADSLDKQDPYGYVYELYCLPECACEMTWVQEFLKYDPREGCDEDDLSHIRNVVPVYKNPQPDRVAELEAHNKKLQTIIAYAYQFAGCHDAPEEWLDVLACPEDATEEMIDSLLPYMPEGDAGKVIALEAQLSAIRKAGNELESYTFYDSLGNNGEGVEEFTGFRNDDWIEFLRVVYEGQAILDTIKEGEEKPKTSGVTKTHKSFDPNAR